MTAIVFYFQAHQPYRLRRDLPGPEAGPDFFDDAENERIVRRVAERCYRPMNAILAETIERTAGRFRCAFSLSGTLLSQLERWAPEALESFVTLARTDAVEFLCETSHHSLAYRDDPREFLEQIEAHSARIEALFGRRPTTFRNTELIIDDSVARTAEHFGFTALLGEGTERLLGPRRPQFVYQPAVCRSLRLLLRSYVYSDDIAFRFSNKEWKGYPLMADTFAGWLDEVPQDAHFIGLFMDYETFGEHQWADTGIFEFMKHLPGEVLKNPRLRFATPSEVAAQHRPIDRLVIPGEVSWADAERDVSAWLGNAMQKEAHAALYKLAPRVRRAARSGSPELLEAWRRLTTSDHVYWMATKRESDGDVHEYFSPYRSPHDAYLVFVRVLDDIARRVDRVLAGSTAR
jgi:alpha-amylase